MGGGNLCYQSHPSMILTNTLDIELENSKLRFIYLGRRKKTTSKQNKTKHKPELVPETIHQGKPTLSIFNYQVQAMKDYFQIPLKLMRMFAINISRQDQTIIFLPLVNHKILETEMMADLFKEKWVEAFFNKILTLHYHLPSSL